MAHKKKPLLSILKFLYMENIFQKKLHNSQFNLQFSFQIFLMPNISLQIEHFIFPCTKKNLLETALYQTTISQTYFSIFFWYFKIYPYLQQNIHFSLQTCYIQFFSTFIKLHYIYNISKKFFPKFPNYSPKTKTFIPLTFVL